MIFFSHIRGIFTSSVGMEVFPLACCAHASSLKKQAKLSRFCDKTFEKHLVTLQLKSVFSGILHYRPKQSIGISKVHPVSLFFFNATDFMISANLNTNRLSMTSEICIVVLAYL